MSITLKNGIPAGMEAAFVSRINAKDKADENRIPFTAVDSQTMSCTVVPEKSGFYSFRTECTLDRGQTWLHEPVPDAWVLIDPYQTDELRLYSLIPTVSGTIDDWITDLSRIKGMGFNAVHLLPVTSMDASESPYSAKDLFGIDYSYLKSGNVSSGLDDLERFVAAAKSLDLRLCFDLVLNHVGVTSNMATSAPDWIVPDETRPDGLKRAVYWVKEGQRSWEDIVLINYEHPSEAIRSEIWAYMTDYALFWAKYANDTGGFVRLDNLHSSNRDFILGLTAKLRSIYSEVGLIAEYFTDDETLLNAVPTWGLNLVMATPWQYKFVPELRQYLIGIHRVSQYVRYFMPPTSHDSGSPLQEFGSVESTVPRYIAAALLGTGTTGMPEGVEWGEAERVNFIGRFHKTLHDREALFGPFLKSVNAILGSHPAFRCGGNCRFVDNAHPAVIAAFRHELHDPTAGFLIVCNFDISGSQDFHLSLTDVIGTSGDVSGVELLSGKTLVFANSELDIILPPCGAYIIHFDDNKPR